MNFFEKIYTKYINLDLKTYFKIPFNFYISKVLFFVFIALIIGCFAATFIDKRTSRLIKKLLRTESIGKENAKTLKELRMSDSRLIKYILKKNRGTLNKIVKSEDRHTKTYEEYMEEERAWKEAHPSLFARITKKNKPLTEDDFVDIPTTECAGVCEEHDGDTPGACEIKEVDTPDMCESVTEDTPAETIAAPNTSEDEITIANGAGSEDADNDCTNKAADGEELKAKVKKPSVEDRLDFESAKFYIDPNMEDYAHKFAEKKNGNMLHAAIYSGIFLACYIGLLFLMPTIVSFVYDIM